MVFQHSETEVVYVRVILVKQHNENRGFSRQVSFPIDYLV